MALRANQFALVSDVELLAEVRRLVACERAATADVIRSLMELDARKLYLAEGYSSLFAYCTQVLHYAEYAALNRIEVARAAAARPVLLDHVADGRLSLTGARLLAPHLRDDNCAALLEAARHKSKREIEEMIAALRPQPDIAATVRKLPTKHVTERGPSIVSPSSAAVATAAVGTLALERPTRAPEPARPAVTPLAPERYKVQFTMTRETRRQLREVQDLVRHSIPNGDVGEIFARALTVLLEDLQRKRCAAVARPRAVKSTDPHHARHIPSAVKREVWRRDGGRCAFVGSDTRCRARGFLEFHHVVPFADGGEATVQNIQLRCRAHNAYEAVLFFGTNGEDVLSE